MVIGQALKKVWHTCERQAGWLFAGGISLALLYNAWRWQKDRQRLSQIQRVEKKPGNFPAYPRVSILLPAWNEAQNVAACIESIIKLRYPQKELVVCAGGIDGTLEIAKVYAGNGVTVIEQYPGEGKQTALHSCFARSTGEIIFLTDADCLLDDVSFEHSIAPLILNQEVASTGSWRPLNRQLSNPFVQYQWTHHLYREMTLPDYVSVLGGANSAIQRKALEQVSAFEIAAPIGTDYVLSRQLTASGYRIRFQRDSRVQTEYPEAFNTYIKQLSRWFRTPFLIGRKWGDRRLVRLTWRAGVTSWGMLLMPVFAPISRGLFSLWLAITAHLVLSQLRFNAVARRSSEKVWQIHWHSWRLLLYLPVGWAGMAKAFLHGLLPKYKLRW